MTDFQTNRFRYILAVTLCYAAGAVLWIVISDSVMGSLADATAMTWLSTTKGLFFVVVTTLLLFASLRLVPNDAGPIPSVDNLFPATSAWSMVGKYLFAGACSVTMLAVRIGVEVSFGHRPMLILFMFPIILSAMFGGLGPGLAATVITSLGIDFFAIPPINSLSIAASYDLFQWSFLVANGVLVSVLSEGLHRQRRHSEATRRLRSVTLASIGDGVITTDARETITFLNPEAERLTGWNSHEAVGQPLTAVCSFAPAHQQWPLDRQFCPAEAPDDRFGPHGPKILLSRDGRELPIQQNAAPIRAENGTLLGTVLVLRDDSLRSRSELRLLMANRTLRVLGMSNQALLLAESESDLFARICDLIVRECGFAMAWIGMMERDGAQDLRPVTWSGCQRNSLDSLKPGWFESDCCPCQQAVRTRQPALCRDILTDPKCSPWREEAVQNGYRSILSLPLVTTDAVIGVISICAAEANGFSNSAITLLSELAGTLAHGIVTSRLREQQASTTLALRQERDFAEALIETTPAIVLLLDGQGRILQFNPYLAELSGWALDEVRGQYWFDTFIPVRDRERIRGMFDNAVNGVPVRGAITPIATRDGRERQIEWYSTPLRDGNDRPTGLLNIGQDVTERLATEAVIREQDAMLREMSAMARIGAWSFDPATGEGTWTDEVARIHDLPPGQQTGKEIGLDFFHGEWRQQIEAAVADAIHLGKPYDLELEMITATGRRKWVRTIGSPVIEAGRVIRVRGSLQDISEQKRAELALRESERTYRSLFDHMLNSTARCRILFDGERPVDIEYLAVNPAFYTTTGLSGPVEGRLISEIIPNYCRDNQDSLAVFARVARTGEPARWEHYLAALDRWFSFSIFSTTPGEIVIIAENISVRKMAELALRESEQRFRDIAEISADWIWEVDDEGRYLFASRNVEALLGYTATELIGMKPFDLMPPEEADRMAAEFASISARCEPFHNLENINRHRDGSLRIVLTSGTPILDPNGALLGYRGVDRDITASRQAELELRDSLAEKVALLKEIHHRVKNNLQIVASLLSLQADRIDNSEAIEALRETKNRVRSMALLHETLYRTGNLARIGLAAYLQDLCDQLLRSFGPVAAGIRIEVRVAALEMPLEQAVPCGLIVNELVNNALKYAFPGDGGGDILVELVPAGEGRLRLRVADTGVGLPPGSAPPAKASTLGLQLVGNLAAQLGGQLTIEPPPEGGAGFTVLFPDVQQLGSEVP